MKTALIAGATGLIGSQLLDFLLASDQYQSVIAWTRKDIPSHKKLRQLKMKEGSSPALDATLQIDDVFCCLGTTMAKARSKETFHQVDFKYPLLLGETGVAHRAKKYLLVSALGANKQSPIYYNRVKGDVEDAIIKLGYDAVHIFRPSLLLGPREEKRSAEDAAKFFYKVFGFLIPNKYKAIESIKVARAMLHFASDLRSGNFIHESMELQKF
jgi:uncharacterized protein YbjT (DUF2867 family)